MPSLGALPDEGLTGPQFLLLIRTSKLACGRIAGMKYRKVRIAWSVVWGILCLSLIALWVRSYWIEDFATGGHLGFTSYRGRTAITVESTSRPPEVAWDLAHRSFEVDAGGSLILPRFHAYSDAYRDTRYFVITCQHWFLVAVSAAFVLAPCMKGRYRLRTLLIGMTVAAIGLGWLVYALRQ